MTDVNAATSIAVAAAVNPAPLGAMHVSWLSRMASLLDSALADARVVLGDILEFSPDAADVADAVAVASGNAEVMPVITAAETALQGVDVLANANTVAGLVQTASTLAGQVKAAIAAASGM